MTSAALNNLRFFLLGLAAYHAQRNLGGPVR